MRKVLSYLLLIPVLFASCVKKEDALVLPPKGTATHSIVDMGSNYDQQIFFDLKSNSVVFTSNPASWHLAFETGANDLHIFLNGGNSVFAYNTHQKSLDQVQKLPSGLNSNGTGWQFDTPSGNPDSTAFGEWYDANGKTKGEVYIVQVAPDRYIKMQLLNADEQHYHFAWLPLEATGVFQEAKVDKNTDYDFSYFSFDQGQVQPEPPKNSWDIVFTVYRYVYHTQAYPNFPYEVRGVLLNPTGTLAAMDSIHSFEQIDLQMASAMKLSNARDVIGFEWKTYSGGRYVVDRRKNYIIQTRDNNLFKLHFLDYYNSSGAQGSPSFEFERLK